MSNASQTNRTCPALGLMDDAETSLGFPSIWNRCYRSRPISSPKLKYQEEFCLCEKHGECPIFIREQTAPLPEYIRAPRSRKSAKIFQAYFLIAIIVTGVILVLAWGAWSRGAFAPIGFGKANETVPATFTPTTTAMPSPTLTVTPTQTRTVTATLQAATSPTSIMPTSTATQLLSKHQLEVPIGTDRKFIIHKALTGENLAQFEHTYNTSVTAIVEVNFEFTYPVWVGALVVIPDGFVDVADMPAFEVYQVTDAAMTVELLAKIKSVDILDLKKYNAIADGESLQIGDWILIPHEKHTP